MNKNSTTPDLSQKRISRRYAAERRFKRFGFLAIILALLILLVLVGTLFVRGISALRQTHIAVPMDFNAKLVDAENIKDGNFRKILRNGIGEIFPEVSARRDKKALYKLFSQWAEFSLRDHVIANPGLIGTKQNISVLASSDFDMVIKGKIDRTLPEAERKLDDRELAWLEKLENDGRVKLKFNYGFFTMPDSSTPEEAGILAALTGSLLTLFVTFAVSFPVGVMAAIYLEEFAPKNRWTDLIEVNINNLAAVPSIIFGLLGLAVFIGFFKLNTGAALVGGLVLALMTLPTIIIVSRAALMAVPPSIREAALGIGASPMQAVLHHALPLALPGMLTGAIIGMARALGETAPLLMIGMFAFVANTPKNLTEDSSTVLPVLIYFWSDHNERGFEERTAAVAIALLVFLILMNLGAVLLRRKFERRW